MIKFAAFFNRYGERSIKPQHLVALLLEALLSAVHWAFPPAKRWMCFMLKKAHDKAGLQMGAPGLAAGLSLLPQFLFCPRMRPTLLFVSGDKSR